MTTPAGFGKKVHKEKKVSAGASKREEASKKYEELKATGLPEYEIYMRVKDKKPWFPVGSIAVKRSAQIHAAIYGNEEELLKGAFRLFPILKRNQNNLEYGFRLKEFKDEDVQLAVRPVASVPNLFQAAIAQVGDAVGGLFKKK